VRSTRDEEVEAMWQHGRWVVLTVMALFLGASSVAFPQGGAQAPAIFWQEGTGAQVPPELARLNNALTELAERLKPGLVQIRVRRSPSEPAAPEDPSPRRSLGSGFIVSPDGYVVTNAHVVGDGNEEVSVTLADNQRVKGRIIGRDRRVDLALVKLENVSALPVLPLGNSDAIRVGELVLALGHPFGLEQTVSFGIVMRKGAPLRTASPGFEFIQTDATVNPGNSGGPLINMAGQVIGVNTLASQGGTIGFAIPVNLVKGLLPQLLAKGRVDWGWLGIAIDEVTEETVEEMKLSSTRGVLVRNVLPGQPAEKGGIKQKDVILSVDGTLVNTPRDLQRIVSTTPVGKEIPVLLLREGKEETVKVVVGLYQEPQPPQRESQPSPHPPSQPPQAPRR
jgi:S1-C subfamily serine protease